MRIEFTEDQIIKLRERLKKLRGSIAEVARREKVTPDWVSRVLMGKAKGRMDIIIVALDVCDELEEKKRKKEIIIKEKMEAMNI